MDSHKLFGKHLWESTAAFLRHYRIQVAIKLPVLKPVEEAEERLRVDTAFERRFKLVGLESIGELNERL